MRWRSFNLLQLIMHYSEALENELKIESRAAHLLLFAEVLLVLSHLIMSFVSKQLEWFLVLHFLVSCFCIVVTVVPK